MTSMPSGARRQRILGAAAVLAGLMLSGCPGEARIQDKGWREAIECVEFRRSHQECREPPRSDAPYVAGWARAIECMERGRNLSACRQPQLVE